ncbi:hypothetical protein MRI28_12685 [Nocardiopsis dassonvillei]|uniref:hypothetical protein n=1 Tax=Nocardiopsis dassonvillei TaxID=2014 RepID=UPI00200BC6FC|nr:hypothetical protein [Nocardiopsis dassonvillei]MCK9870485.1 hypothetical protein [Nocardiopsis dassonvillei]
MPSSVVEVRFAPLTNAVYGLLGWSITVLGAVNVVSGSWPRVVGFFNLFVGAVLLVLAVVNTRRTYFRLEQGLAGGRSVLSGSGRIGPLARGVVAGPGERFAIEQDRLVRLAKDGTRALTPVWRVSAHPGDWRALETALSEAARPREPRTPDGGVS